ncbi:MAG: ATP-binding protein [Polaribacter sp.]
MSKEQLDILQRALKREKAARKAAEKILEDKSRELFSKSNELKESNLKLNDLLDEKSSTLKGIFENINDAYIVMDLFGNVLKMNEVAEDLFGYNLEKEKFNIPNIIYKEDSEYAYNSFKELHTKGFFNNYISRILTKKNQIKWVQVNGTLVYNKNKKPIAAQGIVRDITQIKSLENQKERILKELEKSNSELHEYAHIVSHDLKSPLRSIDALVSWIKADNEGKFDDVTLQNFELLDTTLETMETLISNILEYSSAGSNTNQDEEVDLNTTLIDLKKVLFIPENISVNVMNTLPIVKGGKIKFQQLFQNFISNAIKFCDKKVGIVEIDYKDRNTFYEFSIKDNGIGIEKKYHDKIFQVFHSLNKREDSTGIGLSIVKKIVDLYKGEIWLESEPKKGTTFYFTIKKN